MDMMGMTNISASPLRHLARLAFLAFLLTFVASRTLVILIMTRRMPDLFVHVGGTHVHHLNYGIFLLCGVGAYLLFRRPEGAGAGGGGVRLRHWTGANVRRVRHVASSRRQLLAARQLRRRRRGRGPAVPRRRGAGPAAVPVGPLGDGGGGARGGGRVLPAAVGLAPLRGPPPWAAPRAHRTVGAEVKPLWCRRPACSSKCVG